MISLPSASNALDARSCAGNGRSGAIHAVHVVQLDPIAPFHLVPKLACPKSRATRSVSSEKGGDGTDYTHCYCNLLTYEEQAQEPLCQDFYFGTLVIVILQIGAVFVVSATNTFINMIMNRMAKTYEKHHSMDGIETSLFVRVFVLKFIGTGLLYIILNFDWIKDIVGETGLKEDFSVEWYTSVAPMIIALMISNIIEPHMPVILRWFKQWRRQRRFQREGVQGLEAAKKTDGIFCQDQLNEMYLGPTFHLHTRFSQVQPNSCLKCLGGPIQGRSGTSNLICFHFF